MRTRDGLFTGICGASDFFHAWAGQSMAYYGHMARPMPLAPEGHDPLLVRKVPVVTAVGALPYGSEAGRLCLAVPQDMPPVLIMFLGPFLDSLFQGR